MTIISYYKQYSTILTPQKYNKKSYEPNKLTFLTIKKNHI